MLPEKKVVAECIINFECIAKNGEVAG